MHKSIIASAMLALCAWTGVAHASSTPSSTKSQAETEARARRTAQALFAQAQREARAHDVAAARESLDAALKQDPTFAPARLTRAGVLAGLGETDAALADLAILESRMPRERFLQVKGEALVSGRRYGEAIAVYSELVALKPDSADAYRRRGHARQATDLDKDMPAALADYAKALELDPKMTKIYALRGEILSAGHDEKAVDENYQAWLAQAPDDPQAHAGYAASLARLGKIDRARAEIDRALALAPNAQAYLTRARLTPPDQREAFLADIDKVLTLGQGGDVFAYELRAQRRYVWGQKDLALADIDLALKARPDSLGARRLRARLHQDSGRYDLAIKDLDVVIARQPDQALLYNSRCWARAQANTDLDKALADCDAALKLSPGAAAILDSRGFVKLRRGDLSGAVADYDLALKAKPGQAPSLFGRGVAKRRQGAKAAGDLDLAAARKAQPDVEKQFAGYGVTP
jgi:tetratricopeptide (TPR) repeat protein